MSRAIAWFARNSVAANLLMLLLLIGGLTALPRIRQQSFPDIDIDIINVVVEYPGAAPEEVEEGVCVRIEEEIDGTPGVDELRSTATEGACVVSAQLLAGTDKNKALDDLKARVDALDTLPEEAAMYLAHVAYGLTLTQVGTLFGRDRTTVAYAFRIVEDLRDDYVFDIFLDHLEIAIVGFTGARNVLES